MKIDVKKFDVKQLTSLAQVAESAERYEDMCKFVKELVFRKVRGEQSVSVEERNLLSVAYKNVVSIKRSSWRTLSQHQGDLASSRLEEYKKALENELDDVCSEVIELLERLLKLLVKDEGSNLEDEVFYLKMIADYCRYQAEYKDEPEHKDDAERYYKRALSKAESLEETNPTRLGLALNFSVFCYEIMDKREAACEIAKKAFDGGIEKLDTLNDSSYKDSTLIMQLLRDNLTLWTPENGDAAEQDP